VYYYITMLDQGRAVGSGAVVRLLMKLSLHHLVASTDLSRCCGCATCFPVAAVVACIAGRACWRGCLLCGVYPGNWRQGTHTCAVLCAVHNITLQVTLQVIVEVVKHSRSALTSTSVLAVAAVCEKCLMISSV